MPDKNIRIAIAAIAAVVLIGCGVGVVVARTSEPPPIIITDPGSDPAPPVTGPGPASAASAPQPQPASTPDPSRTAAAAVPVNPPAASAADPGVSQPAPALETVTVYVAGAVRRIGLYTLPAGSRVEQAIIAAQGPAADADLNQLNLAEKLSDGEKIYVPKRGSAAASQAGAANAGNALGYTSSGSGLTGGESPTGPPGNVGRSQHSGKLTSPADGQIDLNTATAEDLERIPEIGPSMAARILAYRTQIGRFRSVGQLRQVTGIGEKKLARMAPFLVVH